MIEGSIAERQNSPSALRAASAFRRRYTKAKRWHGLRVSGGVLLGTVGVAVALLVPGSADYVACAAAAWTVLGRTLLLGLENREQRRGALAHEVFDVEALGLPWNSASTGNQPAIEDLRNWGERQSQDELRDWYTDVRPARRPVDALICQRSSLTWARQDHQRYADILRIVGVVSIGATIALGVVLELSLGAYLLRLGVPALPAVLDLFDIADRNAGVGRHRKRLAEEADRLYERARDEGLAPSVGACRTLQDEIFATRRAMGVPSWFYRITMKRRQRNMEEAATEQVRLLPPELRYD